MPLISELPALVGSIPTGLFAFVDETDNTEAPTGTTKKVTDVQLSTLAADAANALLSSETAKAINGAGTTIGEVGTPISAIHTTDLQANIAGINSLVIGDGAAIGTPENGLLRMNDSLFEYHNGTTYINPLARANHTGTQTASTISDFATATRSAMATANNDFFIGMNAEIADGSIAQGQLNIFSRESWNTVFIKYRKSNNSIARVSLAALDNNAVFSALTATGPTLIGASGSPVSTAALQVDATTKGFLPPRLTSEQVTSLYNNSPPDGLNVFDSTVNLPAVYHTASGTPMVSYVALTTGPSIHAVPFWNGVNQLDSSSSFVFKDDALLVGNLGGLPESCAVLEISDNSRGFLPPRLTTTQRDNIVDPLNGLFIFNTTLKTIEWYDATTAEWKNPNTQSGAVTGAGSANRLAIWDSASNITYNDNLYFSFVTNSLAIGNNGVGSATLHANSASTGTDINTGIFSSAPGTGFANIVALANKTSGSWKSYISYQNAIGTEKFAVGVDSLANGRDDYFISKAGTVIFGIDPNGSIVNGAFTAETSACVEFSSTTKGFRFPRMTTTQKNAIASPAEGLFIWDTSLKELCVFDGSTWRRMPPA